MIIYDLDTEILKPLYGIFRRINVAPDFELEISYSNSTGDMKARLHLFERSFMLQTMQDQGFDFYVAEAILQCFDHFDISKFFTPQNKPDANFASISMIDNQTLPVWEGGEGPTISLTMFFTSFK